MRIILTKPTDTGLQDGLLAYFKEQAKFSDANVEKQLEKEPFNVKELLSTKQRRKPVTR